MGLRFRRVLELSGTGRHKLIIPDWSIIPDCIVLVSGIMARGYIDKIIDIQSRITSSSSTLTFIEFIDPAHNADSGNIIVFTRTLFLLLLFPCHQENPYVPPGMACTQNS